MSGLDKQEQAAIELVAGHFSATWEPADGEASAACMTIAGQRIAVDITIIEQRIFDPGSPTKLRLRFDRVALRLVRDLQASLSGLVPDGEAVVLTVTAPIRLPSRTEAALASRIRDCLAHQSAQPEIDEAICGNQVRVRVVAGVPARMPKVIGFVHNADSDPRVLLRLTHALLRHIGAAANKRPAGKTAGDRWLVVASRDRPEHIPTYRQVCSQLGVPAGFSKILMVLSDRRVEALAGMPTVSRPRPPDRGSS